MRIIIYISLLLLFILPCGKAFAGETAFYFHDESVFSSKEEFRASWESEENARITGEAVLKNFKDGTGSPSKLNASCSVESMKEIDSARGKLLSIIETEKREGTVTEQSLLAAEILKKAAVIDITGLTCREKDLIRNLNSNLPEENSVRAGSFAVGAIPADEFALFIPGTAINTFSGGNPLRPVNRKTLQVAHYMEKRDPGRGFERAHADYYRLFLYMRDDTADSQCHETAYSLPPYFVHLFNSFKTFIQTGRLQKTAVHQKEQISNTLITLQFLPHIVHQLNTGSMEGFHEKA